MTLLASAAGTPGCVGWSFRPTDSLHSTEFFAAPPVMVRRDDGYYVAWTQGSWPFYFGIDAKVRDGRLVLVRGASTSTGDRVGQPHEFPVRGTRRIAALESGGAFWWEPDGTFVKLELRDARTR